MFLSVHIKHLGKHIRTYSMMYYWEDYATHMAYGISQHFVESRNLLVSHMFQVRAIPVDCKILM
jgi:hypothetical protein